MQSEVMPGGKEMTSRRSKNRHHKKPSKATKQRKMPIVDYPTQVPIPSEFKERLRLLNGCATPTSLFKFERPEPERIAALAHGLAYFSSPYDFNDTQDCRLAIDCSLSKEELNSALSPENRWLTTVAPWDRQKQPSRIDGVADVNTVWSISYFKSVRNEYKRGGLRRVHRMLDVLAKAFVRPVKTGGIYCLTDDWRSELMWEKYAHNGSGFVLEFDSQTSPICRDASPIDYVDTFPKIKLYSSAMSETIWNDVLRVPLTKTWERWWQEREWRTWRMMAGFYRYRYDSLVSITFGPKIDGNLAKALLALFIAKYGLMNIRFYQAEVINGQLVCTPIC